VDEGVDFGNHNAMDRRDFLLRFGARAAGLGAFVSAVTGCNSNHEALLRNRVGVSIPYEAEILNELYQNMEREADRCTPKLDLVLVDAEGDPLKQILQIEAFVAQGYGGIVLFVLPEGMDTIVARATAKGISVFNHSATPITGCTQNIILHQYHAGFQVGQAAAQWVNQKHHGRAQIGFLINLTDPQLIVRSNGLKDGVRKHCSVAKFMAEAEADTIDKGWSAASNMLEAHPEMNAILAFSDDPGLGAHRAATESGRTNPDNFFIGSADGIQLALDKIAEGGIYHCTASFFFPLDGVQTIRDMTKSMRGGKVPPTRIMGSRLVTKENVGLFQRMGEDPLAAAFRSYYTQPSVMSYSNKPLTTPLS
jgi:ribose transport system substrate-binding protein